MENMKHIYKKAEIIEAAKEVFGEKGYSAVTMKDISVSCQIGRSSLYHYFLLLMKFMEK